MNTAVASATERATERIDHGAANGALEPFGERVAARVDELAPAERRVAQLLVELGPSATLLSAAALAEQLDTSDATVVRTAKSLGYSGLGELRRALAAYDDDNPPLGERLRRTLEQTPGDELFTVAIRNHLSAIESLTRNVSPEAFQAAVAMAAADRVVWRGVGPSAHLAAYGQLMTQRMGKPSSALVQTGTTFADELLTLAPNNAIVVFAYGRLQSHVRVLLDHAQALTIPVVLITDNLGRKLDAAVDSTLRCGRGAPGLFASHATTLVVIEALVLAIAATDQAAAEANLATLNELRAALVGRRIDVDSP